MMLKSTLLIVFSYLLSFSTQAQSCNVLNIPFTENFDGNNWVPGTGFFNFVNAGDSIDSCWFRPSNTVTAKWGPLQTNFNSYTGPLTDASGTGKFVSFESSGAVSSGIIRSPQIAIVNANQPYLYFKYYLFGADIGTLTVAALSKRTGSLTILKTKTGQRQANKTSAWLEDSVSLLLFSGDTVQISFFASALGVASDMAVDEVEVKNLGINCAAPRNLTQTLNGSNSMTLSWLTTNTNSQTKLRWYNVLNGPSSSVDIPNVSSPYTLSGLQPGNDYVIRLIDSCSSQLTNSIAGTFLTACGLPVSSFTSNGKFLGVNFVSTSQNADSTFWFFDTLGTSLIVNPNYIFPKGGLYQIKLKIVNDCGESDSLVTSIEVCDTLKGNFRREFRNDSILYIADPQNKASAYFWDLDDGFVGIGDTISVKYADFDAKNVTLQAINNCGDTVAVIKNFPGCISPKADWDYTILSPINAGLRIRFNAALSRNASSYIWDFGDGNSDTGIAPVHIYNLPSLNYIVTLRAINTCGEVSIRFFPLNQLGIPQDMPIMNLNVFPNPSEGYVNLSQASGENWHWSIYNALGKKVGEGQLKKMDEGFPLPENINSGIYQLLIKDPTSLFFYRTALKVN
jgi:PKD repeat protein